MLKRMLMVAALMGAGLAAAAEEVSDMAIQLFGKEESGKRVETGALFIDGLYIKGPYEVTRQGNVIFINGRVASRFKVEAKAKAAAEQQAAREAAAKERAEAKSHANPPKHLEGAGDEEAGDGEKRHRSGKDLLTHEELEVADAEG